MYPTSFCKVELASKDPKRERKERKTEQRVMRREKLEEGEA